MKTFLPAIIALLSVPFSSLAQSPAGVQGPDAGWLNEAQSIIGKMEYGFRQTAPLSFACANRQQKVIYTIQPNGYSVEPIRFSAKTGPLNWKTSFNVLAATKGDIAWRPDANPGYETAEAHLLQHHDFFTIEYLNSTEGLRQNFIINRKPQGEQSLQVTIAIKNKGLLVTHLANHQALTLADNEGNTILQYDALKVWDANHAPLPAHMELSDANTLAIVVDDRSAQYPVTIDPLNHSAEWAGTAVGILPTLVGQTAIDAAYGYSVAGLGDVNGDGYDDVAVGAPGLVDIVSGTGTLASVGAVFVYYGKAGGLSATPDAKLQPSTAVAGALFGYSIAGGDINKDGKNDIIVGAPMDQVSISTGGSSTASGTVGKVYVFSGASLTASTTTPLLTLQLSGSGILENGINLSVNALFGFSVAVTDDLNGDGAKDIIVGSPTYAGIKNILGFKSVDVQSGAAFVFLSSHSGNFSLVKLNPPTSSLLGLGLGSTNINGLLFGISVDGAGDYNGDGSPDVVVGAPAGVNLSSLGGLLNGQLLQGSALVYYGTGTATGIQTQPGVTLAATSGGLLTNITGTLSNIANLFGYCVKGVKDINGARTGNILVGAPLGGTLTNLVGGLQVKTGTVSVFVKRSGTVSGTISPNQQLSSPRNSNTVLNLIQSSLLFGFSIDNAYDMNCDGIPDIVIGEPASSGAQLIAANVAGGSAYVFTGNADGTYKTSPAWTLGATYDANLGVNVSSLIGYSVAGGGKVKGNTGANKVLVGAPGLTLDFGTGLLNLGSTLNTLFGLAAGNNGPGKSYVFDPALCGSGNQSSLPLNIINFDAVASANSRVIISWDVVTEKDINSYTIERSSDGLNWQVFGILPGNASSGLEAHFSITDNHPLPGNSYYRLLQLDVDNSSFYTGIKMVSLNTALTANIQVNNPFHQSISMRFTAAASGRLSTDLMDLTGKVLLHQDNQVNAGLNNITISNLSGLAGGMYFIRASSGTQQYSVKLIKE